MKKYVKKGIVLMITALIFTAIIVPTVCFAATPEPTNSNVADVVQQAYDQVATDVKSIFFNIVVPAIRIVLVIALFGYGLFAWTQYKQSHSINWIPIIIIVVCLILSLVLPSLLWNLV